jgi:glycosyltransferase involved in cell wall biosynthesis
MGRALVEKGSRVEAFVMKAKDTEGVGFPVRVIPHRSRGKGLDGEVHWLAASGAMLESLESAGPFDAVYERFSLFAPAGMAYARSHGIPHILEVNAPLWVEAEKYRSLELRETARSLARETLRGAHRVLTVSPALKEIVLAEGVPSEHVQVFPNGVAESFFSAEPAPKPAALEGAPVLLFCGSLKPWHGVSFLLVAFRKLVERRPIGLWIVGDGPLRDEIEEAQDNYPGNVHWEGAVDHERLPGILKAADMAVAPYPSSAPDYFCPLKVIEALAAGCPILASDSAMMRSWVGDPPRAGLFPADSVDGFVSAAESLLDDEELRTVLSGEGVKIALECYTWRHRVEELWEILGWTA